jgi:hypothetical protein
VLDERAVLASPLKIVHQHPLVLRTPSFRKAHTRPRRKAKCARTVPVDTSVWPQDAKAFTQLRAPSGARVRSGAAGVVAQSRVAADLECGV